MAGRAAASRVAARTPRDGQAAVASVFNHAPRGLLTVRRRKDSCSADSRPTRRYDGARSGRVPGRQGIHSEPVGLPPVAHLPLAAPAARRCAGARARATAVFVDSLARAFQVPPPPTIGYYFTDDLIETLGAAGLEFFPLGGDTVGGRSNAPDHLVFIGSSSNGEGYRHELAHVILWPFLAPLQAAGLVQEGLMTWTGGSAGLDFRDLMPGLKLYLDAHPDLTLERVVTDPPPRSGSLDVGYDGLAVLCQMVYDVGGLAGVRSLASAGRDPSAVLGTAARLLNVPQARLDRLWRDRVAALAR